MKIELLIIILGASVLFSLFQPLNADASGRIFWNHQIILDKIVYLSGEFVPIAILGDGNRTVFVEIHDITNKDNSAIFSEQTNLKDESVSFEFTPNYDSDSYQYRIDVYDISPENGEQKLKDSAYFFTKQNADKIIISEFDFEKDKIRPSEGFSFGMKIEDGLGNTLDFVKPSVRMYYETASGEESRGTHEIIFDESSQKYFGWMEIPKDFEFSGIAQMKATVRGIENLKEITSNTVIQEIEIIDSGVKHLCNVNDKECIQTEEIIVKNIHFLTNEIYPNELVFYEAEIVDSSGNPLAMYVTGRVDYQAPWGPSNFSPVGTYDLTKKKFLGELTVPNEIIPGQYTMKLDVHGKQTGRVPFSGISEVDFVIQARPNSFDTLFEPSSLGDSIGESRHYSIGDPRIIEVQLVQGHYYSPPIANHPASILVYGTNWETFEPNLLEVFLVESDSNGFIHKELILDDRNQCSYDVKVISEYDGFEDGHEFDFDMSNSEIFYFQWDDEKIPVTVMGECSIPLSMNFNQPNKTLTIELDTSDAKKQFGIHFPHKLLDGDLTVLINDDVGFDNFSVNKKLDETIVGVDANSNYTKVEIIGTSAIPEFGVIVMMIMLISVLPIILLRKQILFQ